MPTQLLINQKGSYISKRYIRVDEVAKLYQLDMDDTRHLAIAAGALYKLPRIELIHKERFGMFFGRIWGNESL